MRVAYTSDLAGVTPERLDGFFEGWPSHPSPEAHLRLLEGSSERVLAVDEATGEVVGFVTALTDGVLAAFVPLLEVRPAWRGKGIGAELVRRVLARLGPLYAVDVTCDEDVAPFYSALGFQPAGAMVRRDRARQSGRGT